MGFEVTTNEWRDLKFEPSKMPRDTNLITKYFANLDLIVQLTIIVVHWLRLSILLESIIFFFKMLFPDMVEPTFFFFLMDNRTYLIPL